MTANELKTRILLLVQNHSADADLIEELLDWTNVDHYQVIRATRISETEQKLREHPVDVVLLDLSLATDDGAETVRAVAAACGDVPIIVLTGIEDEELALACIAAGAQDYLFKREMHTSSLRRAIGYAILRRREAQVRELQETLACHRALSSITAETTVTAALSGTGAVRLRHPEDFLALVNDYNGLLSRYLEQLIVRKDKPRDQMEKLVTRLGDAGGGPRDLLDVHVAALDEVICGRETEQTKSLAVEGRLLALEMMGLLVDYYRVGNRRRFL